MRRFALGLLALVVVIPSAGYLYLRQSLPKTRGELVLAGLRAETEVLRDRHGIPHIYAPSLEDAHFALGFVHAQDRLWQMEMNRRIGSGRLAEVLGPNALETDRFMRTLGLRRVTWSGDEGVRAAGRSRGTPQRLHPETGGRHRLGASLPRPTRPGSARRPSCRRACT